MDLQRHLTWEQANGIQRGLLVHADEQEVDSSDCRLDAKELTVSLSYHGIGLRRGRIERRPEIQASLTL
jgi:hypothetical protein